MPSTNEVAKGLGGDRNEISGVVNRLKTEAKIIPDNSKRGGLRVAV